MAWLFLSVAVVSLVALCVVRENGTFLLGRAPFFEDSKKVMEDSRDGENDVIVHEGP